MSPEWVDGSSVIIGRGTKEQGGGVFQVAEREADISISNIFKFSFKFF